jgi:ACS family hexuronate transporter-like MFS transporter
MFPTTNTAPATTRTTRVRWTISTLLFVLTVINYADRGVLGAVGPVLIKEFHLSIAQFGIVASAFGWGYCVMVFLSGGIVAAWGPRRTYQAFVTLWSILIAAVATASSFGTLIVLRALFGGSEGTVFPGGSHLIGKWLPHSERARATALMGAGIPVGSLLVVPSAVWLTHAYGWRVPFVVLGALGIVWVVVASLVITDLPGRSQRVSRAELEIIGEGSPEEATAGAPWGRILRSRTLWLTGFAFFSSAYGLYFMLNFFPTYLVRERHVPFTSLALLGTLPWVAMTIGALLSGVISDKLFSISRDLRKARTYFAGGCLIITGMLIALSVSLSNTVAIVAVISVASFVNFVANPMFFVIPIDAAPEHAGPASSLTTGLGSLAGIAAPLLTGALVQSTGTFTSAFVTVAVLPIVFGLLLIVACRPDRL